MSEPTRLDDLLSLWQQAAERGETTSAEELCRDCPDMLTELQRRINVLRQVGRMGVNADSVTCKDQPISPPTTMPANEGSVFPELPGYIVLRELGKGGMGVVYEARDRRLGRTVAVKMLKGGVLSETQRQQFLDEAKAIASLNHPHVVHLFAFGELDRPFATQPYLAMELVQGDTLQQRITGHAQQPTDAAQLMVLLARAVHAAHQQKIIHRDLKPGNVLLAPPLSDPGLNSAWGCPKITDFGLALRVGDGSSTSSREVAGTPSYMAPEQAEGRVDAIGPATDVYALGAMLYELLTARPPFRAATTMATLWQVVHDEPVPPCRLVPDTPKDLETICLKCLQKDPVRRYPTAEALADDLMRFLQGEPIHARPVGSLERAWKWARRKPVIASLLAISISIAIIALAGVTYGWRQAEWARSLEAGRAEYERTQREKTEEQLYFHQIALSYRDLIDGKAAWAEATLRQCPERLRQWEWFHLRDRCARARLAGNPRESALHMDHIRPSSLGSVAASPTADLFASADARGAVFLWEPISPTTDVRIAATTIALLASPGSAGPLLMATATFPGHAATPVHVMRGHLGSVNWLAFSPDGSELLSGGADGLILVWNPKTGKKLRQFEAHQRSISCFALHPSQSWVASTTFERQQPEILIWDRYTLQILHRLQRHTKPITGLAFSPNGEILASCSHDRTIILWDVRTGQPAKILSEHYAPIACVGFSPDGKTLASAAGKLGLEIPEESEILVWDAEKGSVRHRLQGHSDRAVTLAFTPDSQRLVTGGWDRRIIMWNPATGQEVLSWIAHNDGVMSLAFTRDRQLLSASPDRTVRVWSSAKRW